MLKTWVVKSDGYIPSGIEVRSLSIVSSESKDSTSTRLAGALGRLACPLYLWLLDEACAAFHSDSSCVHVVGGRTTFWSMETSFLCVLVSASSGVVGLAVVGVVFSPWDAISRGARFLGMHGRLLIQVMRYNIQLSHFILKF